MDSATLSLDQRVLVSRDMIGAASKILLVPPVASIITCATDVADSGALIFRGVKSA